MSEIEQLRAEITALRERVAVLEARKERLEAADYREYQRMRDDWLRANPMPRPMFIHELSDKFPFGTVTCTAGAK